MPIIVPFIQSFSSEEEDFQFTSVLDAIDHLGKWQLTTQLGHCDFDQICC